MTACQKRTLSQREEVSLCEDLVVVPELLKRKRLAKETMISAQIAYEEARSAFAACKSRIYERPNDVESDDQEIKNKD